MKNNKDVIYTAVNDVHSQLNPTTVRGIVNVDDPQRTAALIKRLSRGQGKVSVAGGRGAMGGQQFSEDGILLDQSANNRVHEFDRELGTITVGAGMTWTQLYEWLEAQQKTDRDPWTFRQKQTGADFLTVGGAVSANAHGRGLNLQPFVNDVEQMAVITPAGNHLVVDRNNNFELFRLICGGYGLFAVILRVTLRLKRRVIVRRTVEELEIGQLLGKFEERIADGYAYGDFQFQIDEKSPDFLRRGVFSCYKPTGLKSIPEGRKFLSPEEWQKLLFLAHTDKSRAYELYLDHYQKSDQQLYYCDEQQMSYYLNYYHEPIDKTLGCKGSEMITELYVPRQYLSQFAEAARTELLRSEANVIYGTIRLIRKDQESFLAWAKEDYACLILNLHVNHSDLEISRNAGIFRNLIEIALSFGGSYYLTYHRWFSAEQLRRAYPQIDQFREEKKLWDPKNILTSDWWCAIEALLDERKTEGARREGLPNHVSTFT